MEKNINARVHSIKIRFSARGIKTQKTKGSLKKCFRIKFGLSIQLHLIFYWILLNLKRTEYEQLGKTLITEEKITVEKS